MVFSHGFCIYAMNTYNEQVKFKKVIILYMLKMNTELSRGSYESNKCIQAIIITLYSN